MTIDRNKERKKRERKGSNSLEALFRSASLLQNGAMLCNLLKWSYTPRNTLGLSESFFANLFDLLVNTVLLVFVDGPLFRGNSVDNVDVVVICEPHLTFIVLS